jgi:hypothetical protein
MSMVRRERLLSVPLGVCALALFGLCVLGFVGNIQIGLVTETLLAIGAVTCVGASLEIESRRITPERFRRIASLGRVAMLAVIVLTIAAIGYLVFIAVSMRDFTF